MQALRTTSLPDAVYDAVRRSIVSIEYAPGQALTETAIALRFGVARPTAKAAIERLVSDGLLRRQANRAATVAELSRDDIDDLYRNRSMVEQSAMRNLAAEGTVPAAALTAHRELLAHVASDDRIALVQDDIAFHRSLVGAQHSPRLARMHDLIMGEIELCTGQVQSHRLITPEDVAAQHQRILDAITAGNADLAATLAGSHVDGVRDRLLAKWDLDHGQESS